MPDTPEFSEAKRALLEKYLKGRGQLTSQTASKKATVTQAQVKPDERAQAIQVQRGSSKRPFFFLHGSWKGTPFFCVNLAQEVDVDMPFYALEAYRFDGQANPSTVETIATAHIKTMRSIQPEGPYLIGGWCNGGLIAYEMARQLQAQGQNIDLLVLMDAMYFGGYTKRKMTRDTIRAICKLVGQGPEKQLDWFLRLLYVSLPIHFVVHALLYVCMQLRLAHTQQSVQSITANESGIKQQVAASVKTLSSAIKNIQLPSFDRRQYTTEVLRHDYLGIIEWIVRGYRPPTPYDGKITFFWPNNEPWHIISSGWQNIINSKDKQDVETYILPGNQDTWRTTHLSLLIKQLKLCLDKEHKDAQ